MTEQEIDKKYKEMQKFLPFLKKVIAKLKDQNSHQQDNPRKAQLEKIQVLHNVLSNREKQLKMEILLKCETVLYRLRSKMEKSQILHNDTETRKIPVTSFKLKQSAPFSNDDIVDITGPASPPPQPIIEEVQPVVIPTERRYSPIPNKEHLQPSDSNSYDGRDHRDRQKHNHHNDSIHYPYKDRARVSHHEERAHKTQDQNLFDRSHDRSRRRWDHTIVTSKGKRSSPAQSHSNFPSNATSPRDSNETMNRTFSFREQQSKAWHDRDYGSAPIRYSGCDSNNRQKKDLYSPAESRDELSKTDTTRINDLNFIDLSNSPSSASDAIEIDKTFHDTIFNFKKQPNKMDSTVTNNIFSRLGEKVNEKDQQQNKYHFQVTVPDVLPKAKISSSTVETMAMPSKSSVVSIPIKVPTIPEVLKSPPLSESDITNLLSESMESNSDSIALIGTRRSPKKQPSVTDTSALDMVRKKFALITKSTFNSVDSPSLPNSSMNDSQKPGPEERLALKYNPHRRVERNSISSNDSLSDVRGNLQNDKLPPKANVNVLPSINQQDPRLRKATPHVNTTFMAMTQNTSTTANNSVPLSQTEFQHQMRVDQSHSFGSRTDRRFVTGSSRPPPFEGIRHDRSYHDQRASGSQFVGGNQHQELHAARPPQRINKLPATNDTNVGSASILSNQQLSESFRSEGKWEFAKSTSKAASKSNSKKSQNSNLIPVILNSIQVSSNPPGDISSEEDWDSELTTNTPTLKTQQQQTITNSASLPQNNSNKAFPVKSPIESRRFGTNHEIKTSDSSKPQQSEEKVVNREAGSIITLKKGPGLSNSHPVPYTETSCSTPVPSGKPTTTTRFNALLNDKSERIKYLESKKKKQCEPRTYGEFKQVQARAAAEQAARKAAEGETVKKPTKLMSEPILKSNETDTAASQTSKTVTVSSLDKLYRSSNFTSSAFPKSNTSFKIPKKQTPQKDAVAECKDVSKKNIDTAKVVTQKLDKIIYKKNGIDAKNKNQQKKSIINEVHKQGGECVNKDDPKQVREPTIEVTNIYENNNHEKDTNKTTTQHSTKDTRNEDTNFESSDHQVENRTDGLDEKTIPDSINNLKKVEMQLPQLNKKQQLEIVTSAAETDPTKDIVKEVDKSAAEVDKKYANSEEVCGADKICVKDKCEEIKLISSAKENIEGKKSISTSKKQIIESPENVTKANNNISPVSINTSEEVVQKLQNFTPKRILQRRSTMFVIDSAPEIDKKKVHSSNALLFEDLQQREAQRKRTEEDAKHASKRNKSLSDIFQKTDDNCSVSTQNIITGKRRTRTTVNFNEVQRTLEIFNYKKPVETKKDIKNEANHIQKNALSEEKTKVPSNLTKKSNQKNTSVNKSSTLSTKESSAKLDIQNASENENCPPSSKLLRLSGTHDPAQSLLMADIEDHNQPSCSSKSSSDPSVHAEEDGNHELLEGFVKDILKPNANTEYIFNLLEQILSEEKLQLVKDIIKSAAIENAQQCVAQDDDNTEFSDRLPEPHNEREMKVKEQSTEVPPKIPEPKKRNRGGYKKRNELDRLNDDIRDMFISEGVLTATGRRMCTLVAAANKNSPKKNESINDQHVSSEIKKDAKANVCDPIKTPINRKPPKAKGKPLRAVGRPLRRSLRSKILQSKNSTLDSEDECAEDDSESNATPSKITKTTVSLTEELSDVDSITSSQHVPVQELQSPIKLSTDEDIEQGKKSSLKKMRLEVKLSKIKSLPRRKTPALVEEDHESDPLSNQTDSDSEASTELSSFKKDIDELVVPAKDAVRNTNLNWHSQSKYAKWCVVCQAKQSYPAVHYKSHHDEHFSSRLAPTILQQFKQGKLSKPLFGVTLKRFVAWFYRCPFCLQQNRYSFSSWVEHFVTHTGEYNFECSKCHKVSNKSISIENHIKQQCPGATLVRNNTFPCGKGQITVKAHVCHLCNFLQLKRENLERHFVQQHGMNDKKIDILGYSIDLIDTKCVKLVNLKDADEMEATAIKQYSQDPMVIVDDDEEVAQSEEDGVIDTEELVYTDSECNPTQINIKVNENRASEVKNQDHENELNVSATKSCPITLMTNLDQDKPHKVYKKKGKPTLVTNTSTGDDGELKQNMEQCEDLSPLKEPDTQLSVAIEKTSLVNNSNAFMPTREANNSPSEDSFAQSLLSIQQEAQTNVPNIRAIIKPSISIAERLSQRFKDMKESQEALTSDEAVSTNIEHVSSMKNSGACFEVSSVQENTQTTTYDNAERLVKDDDGPDTVHTSVIDVEDDEDWEDIEITESAPARNICMLNPVNKTGKPKHKNIFQQINRLYKLKKTNNLSIKKKPLVHAEKDNSNGVEIDNIESIETTKEPPVRPMITNLLDLLPDSPCNDPIELVPELTPLEPLQDLNDISSILDSNLSAIDTQNMLNIEASNSICIDAESQQTSIQEALDFVMEQQQFETKASENAAKNYRYIQQTHINRVSNVGYYRVPEDDSVKFYCLFEHCTFLFSSEVIGLENHYKTEHPLIKWNGSCSTCKAFGCQTPYLDGTFTLSQEIKHMMECHVAPNTSNKPKPRSPSSNACEERPRIKIRRLSGDCLSITTAKSAPFVLNEHTKLCDLLNAKPRPPTKQMPPQLNFQLTDPIFRRTSPAKSMKPVFTSSGSELAITTATSAATNDHLSTNDGSSRSLINASVLRDLLDVHSELPSKQNADASYPIQITNVTSLVTLPTAIPSKGTNSSTANGNELNTSLVPKIANVCSLSARASNADGCLWSQHIATKGIELEKSTRDAMELSRNSNNDKNPKNYGNDSDSQDRLRTQNNESPGPTVVAETLPVGQATSGDFLITQTVSAQYERNGEVLPRAQFGFNISIAPANIHSESSRSTSGSCSPATIASQSGSETSKPNTGVGPRAQLKCMGKSCKYQTRVIVAMSEHLRFHERRNFSQKREYLTCCFCSHSASDVDAYIEHLKQDHKMDKSMLSAKCAKTASTATNPQLQTKSDTKSTKQKSYREKLEETIQDMVSQTGVADSKLYRCVIDNCDVALTESSFHTHLVYHMTTIGNFNVNNYTYKCPHCSAVYQRPASIKTHIRSHMRHRYFCYLCMDTASNAEQILKHFSDTHWRTGTLHTSYLLRPPQKNDDDVVDAAIYYVANATALTDDEVQEFGEKLILEWQRKKAGSKTHFKPSEFALLPTHPIFQQKVFCAECLYKTKVRTNMLRHMQMHNCNPGGGGVGAHPMMANVDPVNPVPCLNTNERHFDKMTNLASSSLITHGGASAAASNRPPFKLNYGYVLEAKRLKCGVVECQYLSITDELFRSHLGALHGSIQRYSCPFCKEVICKRTLVIDRILQHLRFHDQKLFRCEECDYLHFMKNVVERHIQVKHAALCVNVVTHQRFDEGETDGQISVDLIKGKKAGKGAPKNSTAASEQPLSTAANAKGAAKEAAKWQCNTCGYKTLKQPLMITHCMSLHGSQYQYQCVHCPDFSAAQLAQIMFHISEKHDGKKREARILYRKLDDQNDAVDAADTRPLWQRDDPKRVRHIRGILMEDEEESEQYRKRLCLDDVDGDDDDRPDGAAPTKPVIDYQYGCLHCSHKCADLNTLRESHWREEHAANAQSARPFFYRLLPLLKCAICMGFTGTPGELQLHVQQMHHTRAFCAADPRFKQIVCGYCDYRSPTVVQLHKHHLRIGHRPLDIKRLQPEHMTRIFTLGQTETLYQCTLCSALFPSEQAAAAHKCSKDTDDETTPSYRALSGTEIYRCTHCVFASTNELTTLRHMIDHYDKFKICHFCRQPQTSFNGYMQHCYSDHRVEIKRFSEIYTLRDIKKFLQQLLVIFTNGLVVNLRNLTSFSYGNEARIRQLYVEICKTSKEPPIPRLSIARLVARKSIEAKQTIASPACLSTPSASVSTAAAMQLAGNSSTQSLHPKKICKRRSTVAWGVNELNRDTSGAFGIQSPLAAKKLKLNELPPPSKPFVPTPPPPSKPFMPTPPPPSKPCVLTSPLPIPIPISIPIIPLPATAPVAIADPLPSPNPIIDYEEAIDEGNLEENIQDKEESNSHDDIKSGKEDLSKIYTEIAIAGIQTPLTIDQFGMLFKINARVVLERIDTEEEEEDDDSEPYSHVKKPCPASHKHKYT